MKGAQLKVAHHCTHPQSAGSAVRVHTQAVAEKWMLCQQAAGNIKPYALTGYGRRMHADMDVSSHVSNCEDGRLRLAFC
jgi:hypothetical protein